MERSPAKKLLIVLLTVLLGVFLMGIVADAHFPGKACENETPLAKNKHCSEGHGGEDPGQCSDGIDNDGDGLVDEDDPDCGEPPPPPDECTDGIDNDNDGATDGFDRDCDDGSPESGTDEPQCSDGVDNDNDGKTDFGEGGDPECSSDNDDSEAGGPPPPDECTDGIDNDNDGATDGFDRDCDDGSPESGTDEPQCSDGVDNDGDGNVDGDDLGCTDENDDDESDDPVVEPTCGDQDGDGVDHSAFDPDSNEGGLASSIVHGVDQALPSPLGGDQGVVTEVNCALIVTVEEIVGING